MQPNSELDRIINELIAATTAQERLLAELEAQLGTLQQELQELLLKGGRE